MTQEFTLEGRRILDEKTIDGELQQLVETVYSPVWVCTCGDLRCKHITQIIKQAA
jgi:hypothetical protein